MKTLNQMRSNETSSISTEDYQSRVSKLMSIVILRNKVPEWLWLAVQYISKKIPDEDRNLIKKGWDEIYRDPMGAEGFLSRSQESRAGWQEGHKQEKPCRSRAQETEDTDSDDRPEQSIGRD